MSIDGISAFDQISRAAMLDGLFSRCGGKAIPFVRMFYSSPSVYIWEDVEGVEHSILQGEGGEQGDPLMPLLYSLGQHSALEVTQEELAEQECLLAYHDDIVPCPRSCEPGGCDFATALLLPCPNSHQREKDADLELERDQAVGMRCVGKDCPGG